MSLLIVARLIFYALNRASFPNAGVIPFLYGLRFDLATMVFINAPFIVLSLIPVPFRVYKWYKKLLAVLFFVPNALALLANLADSAYFPFSNRRSTAAMFKVASLGDDTVRLLPRLLADYWFLLVVYVLLLGWMVIRYRKITISYPEKNHSRKGWVQDFLIFVIASAGFLVLARGGVQLRPVDVYNAADYSSPQVIPLVLNTPFTIIKTWNSLQLEEKNYFAPNELEKIYTTRRKYFSGRVFDRKPNVVIIILESFSREFVGFLSGRKSYTPFLDSLLGHSLCFDYSFANGKKSIEGIPAILASIPALLDDAYITSAYSSNKIESLASILKGEGYRSSFFHGATNGSMGFDGFCRIAGFDRYFGRTEYAGEQDFDGHWGIWDEAFLQRWAEELDREKQPFLSALFTLSSHHPYSIPDKYLQRFSGGPGKIQRCIQYTDYSLKRFFARIRHASWYPNTLFVITADHTTSSEDPFYGNAVGQYSIPIAFYKPDGSLAKRDTIHTVQQIDIMPSILRMIGYDKPFRCFGKAPGSPDNFAVNYHNGVYQMFRKGDFLQFIQNHPYAYYDFRKDSLLKRNLIRKAPQKVSEMSRDLKAFIQYFNHHLIHNDLAE